MDNQILSLYAKGMTTAFKELYDANVSPVLVSKVTAPWNPECVARNITEI